MGEEMLGRQNKQMWLLFLLYHLMSLKVYLPSNMGLLKLSIKKITCSKSMCILLSTQNDQHYQKTFLLS